uniref:ATP synthase CF0 B' chain subunit II n=1 Tax=Nitzschia sp. PL3-2 TaxID=2083271 RepID=A0A2Z5ZAC2_9STRA|nr:ATP synthase CF0 B' chain subunit II [Nitzschia sp. PL3-2]
MLFLLNATGPDGLFDIDATLPILGVHFFVLFSFLHFFLYNPLQKKKEQRNIYTITNYNNTAIIILFLFNMLFNLEVFLNFIYDIEIIIFLYINYIHKKFLNFELIKFSLNIIGYYKLYLKKKFFLKKKYKKIIFIVIRMLSKKIIKKLYY